MSAAAAASMAMPTGDLGNKVKAGLLIALAVLVVVIVIIAIKQGSKFFNSITDGVDSVLEGIGLKKSEEDIKADTDVAAVDAQANSVTSPFNPTFYKSAPAGTRLKTQSNLEPLADQIYDSVGILYDDPESALGAFKQCSNWCMVSQLSDKFNQLYGKDVYDWMKIKFDTTKQKDTLAKIVNYCFSLPKFS